MFVMDSKLLIHCKIWLVRAPVFAPAVATGSGPQNHEPTLINMVALLAPILLKCIYVKYSLADHAFCNFHHCNYDQNFHISYQNPRQPWKIYWGWCMGWSGELFMPPREDYCGVFLQSSEAMRKINTKFTLEFVMSVHTLYYFLHIDT